PTPTSPRSTLFPYTTLFRSTNKVPVLVLVLLTLFSSDAGANQVKLPPETKNAALRYWQAFAELKDPPPVQGIQQQIEKVLSGERSEEHTSELQSLAYLVCRLLLEKKKTC